MSIETGRGYSPSPSEITPSEPSGVPMADILPPTPDAPEEATPAPDDFASMSRPSYYSAESERPEYAPPILPPATYSDRESAPTDPGRPPVIEAGDRGYEQRALDAINELVQRDNERASERYRGPILGKAREWFSREGKREEAKLLEQAGNWNDNAKWKKWAKIGAKVAGGAGLATAMVMTGGVGAILTPLLWSIGAREAISGALEAVEEVGWGGKRGKAERGIQANLSEKINELKAGVVSGEIDEAKFQKLVNEMLDSEKDVIAQQEKNSTSERKWRLGRSIAASVGTIGLGLFTGVPLGTHDYDGAREAGKTVLDETHKTFFNWRGGQFLYNDPAEMMRVAQEVATTNAPWTVHGDMWGQASHVLGHGLPLLEKIGLGSGLAYLAGRSIEESLPRGKSSKKSEYSAPGGTSYSAYSMPKDGGYGTPPREGYRADYSAGGPASGEAPKEGPEGERSPDKDREALEKYVESFSDGYKSELEFALKGMPPMAEECRAVVCIPAAYSEHRTIYQTLESYLGQQQTKDGAPLDSSQFEILVCVNGPQDKHAEVEQTLAEITKFQQEHPELNVRTFGKEFASRAPIGEIRKYPNDLALMRSLERKNPGGPLVLVSNDADNEGLSSTYIDKAVQEFDADPKLEMIAGKVDYKEEDYQKYPYLLASRRLWQFVDIVGRYGPDAKAPKALGSNSFVRAQSYAEVNGYSRTATVAEDLILGSAVMRKSGKDALQYKNIALRTNARRDLDAIQNGRPIVRAYDRFGADESLREDLKVSNVESLTPDKPEFQKHLESDASALLAESWAQNFWPKFDALPEVQERRRAGRDVADLEQRFRSSAVGEQALQDAMKTFDRAMGFWGASYTVDRTSDGRIRVKLQDWSKLKEGLNNFGK